MRVAVRVFVGSAIVAAVVGLWVLIAPYYSTLLWWELRRHLFWMAPLLVGSVGVVALLAFLEERGHPLWPGVLLLLAGGVGFLFWVFALHPYLQDRTYVASVQVTADPAPEFGQRAPYVIAEAQARPNLGDSPGDIAVTSFVPQEQSFGTVVKARGWLAGYQTVLA